MSIFSGRLSRKNFGLGILLVSGIPILLLIPPLFYVSYYLNNLRAFEASDSYIPIEEMEQPMEQIYSEDAMMPEL